MRSPTCWRTCLSCVFVGFVVAGGGPHSAADVKQTEARLAAAGVDEAVRAKVHGALGRAAEFLIKGQEEDGSFREHWKRPVLADPIRTTLLCALALRQVGTKAANESVGRAAAWVLAQDVAGWGSIKQNVQSAGLALMLRDSMPDFDLPVEATARALVGALDEDTGYWGSSLCNAASVPVPSIRDSQLAVLCLWCARRQGVKLLPAVWVRHARGLADEQTKSGAWRWHPDKTLAAMGHPADPRVDTGIPAGRYIGLANLRFATAALQDVRAGRSRRKQAVKRAMRRQDVVAAGILENPARMLMTMTAGRGKKWRVVRPHGSPGRPGDGAYRTLWTLGQALILHDVEDYERPVPGSRKTKQSSWFLDGAEWLLRVQGTSGGWSPTAGKPVTSASEIDTAYAMLFLSRAVAALHPDAPRPAIAVQQDPEGEGD